MRLALLLSLVSAFTSSNLASRAGPQLPDRIFVMGDLHGDYQEADRLFRAANITDSSGNWRAVPGKKTWFVQLGDIVDRGPDSLPLYTKFKQLTESAEQKGDLVVNLLGNHELMNLCQQFHYVSPDEFVNHYNGDKMSMVEAWRSGGQVGDFVRDHFEVAVSIGDVVFVHAGLETAYSKADFSQLKQRLFADVDSGVCGKDDMVVGTRGPLWTRRVSRGDCDLLSQVLKDRNASVMVVGHTPTDTGDVEVACNGQLVMADVGISRWVRGSPRMVLIEKVENKPLSQWRWTELGLNSRGYAAKNLTRRQLPLGENRKRQEF